MPFVDQLPCGNVAVRVRHTVGYSSPHNYIRFSHRAKSWQRQATAFGWISVSVQTARALFDAGWKVWGES